MRKLSKEDIQFIDQYLIKSDVKFWDVRTELLDHIILAVEDKINNKNITFNEALLEVHEGFGNKLGHFKSPSFEQKLYYSNKGFTKFILQRQKETRRKYRKQYKETFWAFLMSKTFLLEFAVIIITVFTIFNYNQKVAFIVAICYMYLPEFLKLGYLVFEKSSRKSLNVQIAVIGFNVFLLINFSFIQGFNIYFEEVIQKPYVFLIIFCLAVFPLLRQSLNIFKLALKKSKERYKLLTS
ncbi:hypothetical protein [Yeosuana marina]|uniref:hypothetical protein n=1 Tax=Yeosuana marina TaxID=1565536 RepID=UPI00141DC143|nr:hypothetical protein [Yeosuana marina]